VSKPEEPKDQAGVEDAARVDGADAGEATPTRADDQALADRAEDEHAQGGPAEDPRAEDEPLDPGLAALDDEPAEVAPPPPRPDARPEPRHDGTAPEWMVGVRLADGEVLDFDPRDLNLRQGDMVVVDNERDLNLGRVVYRTQNTGRRYLRRVVRPVSGQDLLLLRNRKREEEAIHLCNRCIAERGLAMKLVRVAYLHGGNKAVFFFTADGRVDFRTLVRDLAQQLHVRIEMRQIGVRDEARLLTGCGICGQPLCCARYLRRFVPVSIKMAKNQGLALNPQKVSGVCGRLMCCLVYEDAIYKELRQGFPKVGKTIETPRGPGKVLEADVLGGKARVLLDDGIETFTIEEIRSGKAVPRQAEPRGGRPRPTGSIVSRVRERLQEARSGTPGLSPEAEEPPAQALPPDEDVQAQTAPTAQSPKPPAAPGGRGEPAERTDEAGERRGRRRRRRRHGARPAQAGEAGGGQAPAEPRRDAPRRDEPRRDGPRREERSREGQPPDGQPRDARPQPAAEGASPAGPGEGAARRSRRRRRRRHPGGGAPGASSPANPSPGPGPTPAAG